MESRREATGKPEKKRPPARSGEGCASRGPGGTGRAGGSAAVRAAWAWAESAAASPGRPGMGSGGSRGPPGRTRLQQGSAPPIAPERCPSGRGEATVVGRGVSSRGPGGRSPSRTRLPPRAHADGGGSCEPGPAPARAPAQPPWTPERLGDPKSGPLDPPHPGPHRRGRACAPPTASFHCPHRSAGSSLRALARPLSPACSTGGPGRPAGAWRRGRVSGKVRLWSQAPVPRAEAAFLSPRGADGFLSDGSREGIFSVHFRALLNEGA